MSDNVQLNMDYYHECLIEPDSYYLPYIDFNINNSYVHYLKTHNLEENATNYSKFVDWVNNQEENEEVNKNYRIDKLLNKIDNFERFINVDGKMNYFKLGEYIHSIFSNLFSDNEFDKVMLLDIFALYHNLHWFIESEHSLYSISDLNNAFDLD